jgi:hypothetical protein
MASKTCSAATTSKATQGASATTPWQRFGISYHFYVFIMKVKKPKKGR